jgi:hypothetical protein
MYERNLFLTLTCDDEHLPKRSSLCKMDFQLFLDRLSEDSLPCKLRYFGCGEYVGKYGCLRCHAIFLLTNLILNQAGVGLSSIRLAWECKDVWAIC